MNYVYWILVLSITYPTYLLSTNIPTQNYLLGCYKKTTCFTLEHANTYEKKQKGLMYRKTLPDKQGMIFSWKQENYIDMWMKNTYIALDMIWLNSKSKIVCLKENTMPLNVTPIKCHKKARYVIELSAGSIKKYNLKKHKKIILLTISEQQ